MTIVAHWWQRQPQLPLLVPWLITLALFKLPGDLAELICPRLFCAGTETLAASLHLDEGPLGFYSVWMSSAFGVILVRLAHDSGGAGRRRGLAKSSVDTGLVGLTRTGNRSL